MNSEKQEGFLKALRAAYGDYEERPSYREIAEDFSLWQDYVDTLGTISEADFDNLSVNKKISMIEECFGK